MSRLFVASVVGGVMSTLIPVVPMMTVYLKAFGLLMLPFIFRKCSDFKSYCVTLIVFLCVTLFLGGTMYAITCAFDDEIYLIMSYGPVPILFSISGVCLINFIQYLRSGILKERRYNNCRRRVKLSDGISCFRGEAYFDSGNRVYANNGEPVTIVGERIYNRFIGEEDYISVSTVTGITVLKAKDAEIKIYSDNGDNIIYKTKIAFAPFIAGGEEIILHSDMGG